MQNTAIGIDLGTTYSCVGVWKNNAVDIIANSQGNRTTPSYVAFTDNERLVGDAAKNQVSINIHNINNIFYLKTIPIYIDTLVRLNENIQSTKIHEFHHLSLMFRIHFSKEKIMDVRFVAWNRKGKILEKFFRFFNSRFGMSILACMLKISQPLYPKLLGHFVDDGRYVLKPSISWIMKNFTKI